MMSLDALQEELEASTNEVPPPVSFPNDEIDDPDELAYASQRLRSLKEQLSRFKLDFVELQTRQSVFEGLRTGGLNQDDEELSKSVSDIKSSIKRVKRNTIQTTDSISEHINSIQQDWSKYLVSRDKLLGDLRIIRQEDQEFQAMLLSATEGLLGNLDHSEQINSSQGTQVLLQRFTTAYESENKTMEQLLSRIKVHQHTSVKLQSRVTSALAGRSGPSRKSDSVYEGLLSEIDYMQVMFPASDTKFSETSIVSTLTVPTGGHVFTAQIQVHPSSNTITGIHVSNGSELLPVFIDDIIENALAHQDLQSGLQEIVMRLDNFYARSLELELLYSTLKCSWNSSATIVEFVDNDCVVSIHPDYPTYGEVDVRMVGTKTITTSTLSDAVALLFH